MSPPQLPPGWELDEAPATNKPSLPAGWDFDEAPAAQGTAPASGLGQLWPVRLAKSLYEAATLPGDVYQGNATVPQSANMPGGEDTSAIPRVTTLAGMMPMSTVGGVAGKVVGPTEEALEKAKNSQYDAAANNPIEFHPQAMDALGRQISGGLGIDPILAPKTFGVLGRLSEYDGNATAQSLRTIQRSLNKLKNTNPDPTERFAAGQAANDFNRFLENTDQVPSAIAKGTPGDAAEFSALVKEANANNTALKKSQSFTQSGANAELRANSANSGLNVENNLRSQVTKMLEHPQQLRGLDDETLAALKEYNAGSRTANTMRILGNLFGGGGGLGMLVAGGVGHLAGLPFETAPAAGLLLKTLGNKFALNKYADIGNLIRANSPLGRQTPTPRNPYATPPLMPMLGVGGSGQQ